MKCGYAAMQRPVIMSALLDIVTRVTKQAGVSKDQERRRPLIQTCEAVAVENGMSTTPAISLEPSSRHFRSGSLMHS